MIVNSYESLNHRHSKISPRQTLERKKHDGFLELRMKRKRVCLCGKETASRRKHFSCTWKISLGVEASPEVEYSVHVTSLNTETIQVFWMQLCVWAFPASCKCSISSEGQKEIRLTHSVKYYLIEGGLVTQQNLQLFFIPELPGCTEEKKRGEGWLFRVMWSYSVNYPWKCVLSFLPAFVAQAP